MMTAMLDLYTLETRREKYFKGKGYHKKYFVFHLHMLSSYIGTYSECEFVSSLILLLLYIAFTTIIAPMLHTVPECVSVVNPL